ncbi:MAG TPA: polyprenol monophosphomannose synthase [Acidimicrobiales bacterium]|nr:polyprenol monophosphomannose synthase [Acidimicrobiales bacterium]
MKTLVVLPTYNEAHTIEEVLRRTRAALPSTSVLVVDDGSPDGTADLVEKAAAGTDGIELLRRDRRGGLGDAYRAGFAWGLERGAEALFEMDSDLSHDPAALPALLAALEDHDLVIGSRYVPGGSIPQWGLHRRLLSRAGNAYSALMLGVPVRDMTSGFRAYRAGLLESMALSTVTADGYGFQIEMAYRAARAGARITEVPIRFVDREFGDSKMSLDIVVEALRLVTRWGLARLWASARNRTGRAPGGRPA